ncbi:hypothetical protein [Nocardiopsis sp. FIRDI 009]|uniref:hypothetical protein n=1 Tax=Nocardiopsis sp. FIRDI 009 TaxID=714197 RepID=UPI000E279B6F|nr:hypothetical protein [Nocardiopsis sp. FIRDI 009]
MPNARQEFVVPAVSEARLAELTAALHDVLASLRVECGRVLLPPLAEFADLGIAGVVGARRGEAARAGEAEAVVRLVHGEHLLPGAVYRVRLPEVGRPDGEDRPEEEPHVEVTVHAWDRVGTSWLTVALLDGDWAHTVGIELRRTPRGFSWLGLVGSVLSGDREVETRSVTVDADRWAARLRGEPGPAPVSIRVSRPAGRTVFRLTPVATADGRWTVLLDAEADPAENPARADATDPPGTARLIATAWRLLVAEVDLVTDLRRAADALRRADPRFPLTVPLPNLAAPDGSR